jgi:NADH-quinone oxidoreductase subunit C
MEDRRAGMGIETPQTGLLDSDAALKLLAESFPGEIVESSVSGDQAVAVIRPESLTRIMTFLKENPRLAFNVLLDLTAVDYLERRPRFEVVYHLLSMSRNQRLRVKVRPDGDNPVVESVAGLWHSADWLEREVWDMFGIRFAGHPDLKRILLYEEFQGHPLRKDYPIRKRQPLIGPKT